MKLVVIVDNSPLDGGGFVQAVSSAILLIKLCKDKYSLDIVVTNKNSYEEFNKLNMKVSLYKFGFFDKIYNFLSRTLFFNVIINKFACLSKFEKYLIKNNCDLVFFVTPSALACSLQKLNYVYSVWDMSYRINMEFPETRELGKFKIRDSIYRFALERAFLVITTSDDLSQFLCDNFSISRERMISIPLQISPFLRLENSSKISKKIEKIKSQDYFLYPAQFWSHKNHIRVLQALNFIMRSNKKCPILVFTGGDKGNLARLKKYVKRQKLDRYVFFFDFLNYNEFNYVYRNAHAIVMPTYFGPNNIVPLEAWTLKIPLIYSKGLEIETNAGALLIDPDNYKELASAMSEILNTQVRKKLIAEGEKALEKHELKVASQTSKLKHQIEIYEKRMETWVDEH